MLITSVETQKRQGWTEAFQEMVEIGDDQLLIPDVLKMKISKTGLKVK